MMSPGQTVMFFDGVCGLCDRTVDFVIRHDKKMRIKFMTLQDPRASQLFKNQGESNPDLSTVVVMRDENIYLKSDAFLEIMKELGWPWSIVAPLRLLPRFIRDSVYDWIARNRFRFFGRRESCRIPTAKDRARFL